MDGMVAWEESLDDKQCTGRSRKIDMEEDMEMDPKMMMYNQEEIQEDAYILVGMWYLNNWVLTSRMSKDQWKASAEIVGHWKNGKICPGLRMKLCPSKVSHTEGTKLSQNLNLILVTNIN